MILSFLKIFNFENLFIYLFPFWWELFYWKKQNRIFHSLTQPFLQQTFIEHLICTEQWTWAEDAVMSTAWPLPQRVLVLLGNENVNRLYTTASLVLWEQWKSTSQRWGVRILSERIIWRINRWCEVSFHPEGKPWTVFPVRATNSTYCGGKELSWSQV